VNAGTAEDFSVFVEPREESNNLLVSANKSSSKYEKSRLLSRRSCIHVGSEHDSKVWRDSHLLALCMHGGQRFLYIFWIRLTVQLTFEQCCEKVQLFGSPLDKS